jgi:hypothetical protein
MYISNYYVAASNCSWAPFNRNGANAVIVAEIGLKYRLYASELLLAVDLEVRAHWWRLAPTDWLPTADSRASGSPRSLDHTAVSSSLKISLTHSTFFVTHSRQEEA